MERSNVFLSRMEDLVRQILAYYNVPCYRIDSTVESHITTEGNNIEVPVIRVAGFFEDTVTRVSKVLSSEFELSVIKDNGQDAADNFSTSAQVYMASLKAPRTDLPEYKALSSLSFEVHVSSILHDVYAAMQHDISADKSAVPSSVKRDFFRVGAFLEMADIEFLKIRKLVSGQESTLAGGSSMISLPEVSRSSNPVAVAPAPQAVEHTPAPQPAKQEVAATKTEEIPSVSSNPANAEITAKVSEQNKNSIESMDMNVDSFDALAVSIGNIEDKSNVKDESYIDLITNNNKPAAEPIAEAAVEVIEENKAAATTAAGAVAPVNGNEEKGADGVALNIDNIETFNMNVSGMIERTTEIIREGNDKPVAAEVETTDTTPQEVDENTQMNENMLKEYVSHSKLVKEIDGQIAERAGAKINDELDIEGDVERLRFLKVFTIKQLNDKLTDNKDDIVAFAEKWIGKDNGGSFDSGICLFYLEYLLVGKKNDPAFAVEYVLKFISDNDYSARYIIPTYNSIRNANEPSSNFAHLTLK